MSQSTLPARRPSYKNIPNGYLYFQWNLDSQSLIPSSKVAWVTRPLEILPENLEFSKFSHSTIVLQRTMDVYQLF